MKRLRLAVATLLPLLTASCLESLEPLIPVESAVTPFRAGYAEICKEAYPAGSSACEVMEVRLDSDKHYEAVSVDDKVQQFTFAEGEAGHARIVQIRDGETIGYGFLSRQWERWLVVSPDCKDMPDETKAALAAEGSMLPKDLMPMHCVFASLTAIRHYLARTDTATVKAPGLLASASLKSLQFLGDNGHQRFAAQARAGFAKALADKNYAAAVAIASLQYRNPTDAAINADFAASLRGRRTEIAGWAQGLEGEKRRAALLTGAWSDLLTGNRPDLEAVSSPRDDMFAKGSGEVMVLGAAMLGVWGDDAVLTCRTIRKIRILQPDRNWSSEQWLDWAGRRARCVW